MDRNKIFLLGVGVLFLAGFGAAFHLDGLQGYGGIHGQEYPSLEDPRKALTNFVAPFLLIAIVFQRGFEKALTFTYADDDNTPYRPFNQSEEKEKVRKYSMIMSLAVTGMIVPSPYFWMFQDYVAVLFGAISYLFFGGIFAAFIWILWKVFS